jgi:hypothetical protein
MTPYPFPTFALAVEFTHTLLTSAFIGSVADGSCNPATVSLMEDCDKQKADVIYKNFCESKGIPSATGARP